MKRLFFAMAVTIPNIMFAADWELVSKTDAMTDEKRIEATIENPEKDRFTVMRRSDGKVWGFLSLGGMHQFGIIDSILARFGNNEPLEYNDDLDKLSEELGTPMNGWEWNPKLIGFLMWHGNIDEGCGKIVELSKADRLIFRYQPNQSTERDVFFRDIADSSAIPEALGINLDDCPSE